MQRDGPLSSALTMRAWVTATLLMWPLPETAYGDDHETLIVLGEASRRRGLPRTRARLTREELVARGVTRLSDALAQLPEVTVHRSRRGSLVASFRGARQNQLLIIVDGVPVQDPWRGAFDLDAVPASEIVEIRMSTSPASPLDGLGGTAGIIEIVTRPALGPQLAIGQIHAVTSPGLGATATARGPLLTGSPGLGALVSAGGSIEERSLSIAGLASRLSAGRETGFGSARARLLFQNLEIFVDTSGSRRTYLLPPDDVGPAIPRVFERVTREDRARVAAGLDVRVASLALSSRLYGQLLIREATRYRDPLLQLKASDDRLEADRVGAAVLLEAALGPAYLSTRAALERAQARIASTSSRISPSGQATFAQWAVGLRWGLPEVELAGSAGGVAPVDGTGSVWPEGQARLTLRPIELVELVLVGGHKGRPSTLAERFDVGGDPVAPPEQASFAEAQARVPLDRLELSSAGYLRWVKDFSGFARTQGSSRTLVVGGVEARARWAPHPALEVGAAFDTVAAGPAGVEGRTPLNFVPAERAEVSMSARLEAGLGGWLRLRYVGEQIDQDTVLPARTTLDVALWLEPFDAFRTTLRAENLTHTAYEIRSGLRAEGPTFTVLVEAAFGEAG